MNDSSIRDAHDGAFGHVLKHYRHLARLTQEELAELAGVSRLTISALERGVRHIPHKDTLQRLGAALQLPSEDQERFQRAARRTGGFTPIVLDRGTLRSAHLGIPLIGRSEELKSIQRHIEGAGPPLLLISGEPGIGKTRLLHEAESYAVRYGHRVIRAACGRTSPEESFAPLTDALTQHFNAQSPAARRTAIRTFPWLVDLLPEYRDDLPAALPTVPLEHKRRLVRSALGHALTSPSSDRGSHTLGTLLILDDLQWVQQDLLQLLIMLIRWNATTVLTGTPLKILGAYHNTGIQRSDSLMGAVTDLASGGLTKEIALEPLGIQHSKDLLRALTSDESRVTMAAHAAGGVPFFLISLALEATDDPGSIPCVLLHAVCRRLESLTGSERQIIEVASLMAEPVTADGLARIVNRSEVAVAHALDSLHLAKLLQIDEHGTARFPNLVIRHGVQQALGSATRAALRRRIKEGRTSG